MNILTELPEGEQSALLTILLENEPNRRILWLDENWNQFDAPRQRFLLAQAWIAETKISSDQSPVAGRLVSMFRDVGFISDCVAPDLPNPVTVYRGCLIQEIPSMAWTTDIAVATEFARTNHLPRVKALVGFLLEAQCPKSALLGYISGRKEFEAIVDPSGLQDLRWMKEVPRIHDDSIQPTDQEELMRESADVIAETHRLERQYRDMRASEFPSSQPD